MDRPAYPGSVPSQPTDAGPSRASRTLLGGTAVAAVQALGLGALAVAELAVLVAERVAVALTTATFFAVCALGLGWCALGLRRSQPWARGPLVVAQVLLLLLAWSYHQPYPLASAVVAGLAVLGLVLLLHPATSLALDDQPVL